MAQPVRIRIRKYNGDDAYSWAVFVDGHPAITGLSHREAFYHQKELRKMKGFQ